MAERPAAQLAFERSARTLSLEMDKDDVVAALQLGRQERADGASPGRARSGSAKKKLKKKLKKAKAQTTAGHALAGARPDGLEHGTRVWVQDSEHARAGQFGVIVEVQGTHVVRVHFDEQWNGDRGEVIRRSFVIPADWKDHPERRPLVQAHPDRTATPRGTPRRRRNTGSSAKRTPSSAAKETEPQPEPEPEPEIEAAAQELAAARADRAEEVAVEDHERLEPGAGVED